MEYTSKFPSGEFPQNNYSGDKSGSGTVEDLTKLIKRNELGCTEIRLVSEANGHEAGSFGQLQFVDGSRINISLVLASSDQISVFPRTTLPADANIEWVIHPPKF